MTASSPSPEESVYELVESLYDLGAAYIRANEAALFPMERSH
jgi:hypothetical protein